MMTIYINAFDDDDDGDADDETWKSRAINLPSCKSGQRAFIISKFHCKELQYTMYAIRW